MRQKHLLLLALLPLSLFAQKKEEGFDIHFKPTKDIPRYYVVTEQKNGKWHREAWYIPEKSFAMEGWFLDENCRVGDSSVTWFFPNKKLKSSGSYKKGRKEGIWLEYHNNGMMSDSEYYENGHQLGVGLGWSKEGYMVDSTVFDGLGNGVLVHWYEKGPVYFVGYKVNDTTSARKWTYYHRNGQKMAIVEYNNGIRTSVNCFSETGQPLENCEEKESFFGGDEFAWRKFLEKNLDAGVPVRNRAPVGKYTVVVQFIVDRQGHLSDITPLTNFGFGMEGEVIRLLKKSPPWSPAIQFGKIVDSYKKQPVTFVVASR